MSTLSRYLLATVLVVFTSLLILIDTAESGPDSAAEDVEARIVAKRLADGRTEFAIEYRQAESEWSQRLLPRRRFVPSNPTEERWLSSTPVSLGKLPVTVRIVAHLVSDSRIEFALQRLLNDGSWSKRILPAARFIPATPEVETWLTSSPVGVALPFVGSVETDRAALVELFTATDGDRWHDNTNWLSDAPLGDWFGVRTDAEGRVVALELSNNTLRGSLPAAIGQLTRLQVLDLSGGRGHSDEDAILSDSDYPICWGYLSGPIPPELGNLRRLQLLNLACNGLTGSLPPELGQLANLETLSLWFNDLSGPIPSEIGQLEALKQLRLEFNGLSGHLPEELGRLSNLRYMSFYLNNLSGSLPASFGKLSNLQEITLAANSLSGPIPGEWGNLSSLERLELGDNELSGPIPTTFGRLSNLSDLSLVSNQIEGPLPASLGGLPTLSRLYLNWNRISGPIPPEWGTLETLRDLRIGSNMLSGEIPDELGQLTNLQNLELYGNKLTGPIPESLGNLSNLDWQLSLSHNELEGSIPASLAGLNKLRQLHLADNRLSGSIPAQLGKMERLYRVDLDGNEFADCFDHTLPTVWRVELTSLGLELCVTPSQFWPSKIGKHSSSSSRCCRATNSITAAAGRIQTRRLATGLGSRQMSMDE